MKHLLHRLAVASILLVTASGCASKKATVSPGEAKKLYTPEGLYVNLYVDSEDSGLSSVIISSEGYSEPQMGAHYNGKTLERILIIEDKKGIIFDIDGNFTEPRSYTIKAVTGVGGDEKEVKEYRLELIESTGTK